MLSRSIYTILTTNTAVAALLGTKIYPLTTPETVKEPFAIYQLSLIPTDTKDGKSKLDIYDLEIVHFSKKYETSQSILIAIRAALDRYSASTIDKIWFEDAQDFYDSNSELFGISHSYKIRLKIT